MTPAECMRLFVGKAVKDEAALIEARTGRPLTDEWLAQIPRAPQRRPGAHLRPVAGAAEAVAARCMRPAAAASPALSGADRFKVELQLAKCGLMRWFEGRIFSGHELPRSKPAPDVYLAAAAALGVDPRRCAVVEDTVTGVTAGVAAGATVFGYSPPEAGHDAPAALRKAGAVAIFTRMCGPAGPVGLSTGLTSAPPWSRPRSARRA